MSFVWHSQKSSWSVAWLRISLLGFCCFLWRYHYNPRVFSVSAESAVQEWWLLQLCVWSTYLEMSLHQIPPKIPPTFQSLLAHKLHTAPAWYLHSTPRIFACAVFRIDDRNLLQRYHAPLVHSVVLFLGAQLHPFDCVFLVRALAWLNTWSCPF